MGTLIGALTRQGIRASRPVNVFDCDDDRFRCFLRRTLSKLTKEYVYVAFFDGRRHYLGDYYVAGCESEIVIRGRQLFTRALNINAAAVVLAHNHPSGRALPSPADIESTRRLAHVGEALEIELLDHLIVGGDNIYSMKQARIV
ncbi:JAB domain-containing protein [Parablastomonas sp. CN1-191]|uniref:JAB domain-containing protein n=1 Tax=Parablastomonas sp. CN1-191 TaxID=3400908 RepID=UPI003BF78368